MKTNALVEVHDEPELKRALSAGASFIGINNRNLATFQVDIRTTETLARLIPTDCLVISESASDRWRIFAGWREQVFTEP